MNKPRRKINWKKCAWLALCLTLLGLVIKNSIQLPPSLPEPITLIDGTIMTIEKVEVTTDPKFIPASAFSKSWLGRISQWWRNRGPLDTTPLQEDFIDSLAPNLRQPPFVNPALCVWISFKDPKTGLCVVPPRKLSATIRGDTAHILPGRSLREKQTDPPLLQWHGDTGACLFVWDYFPRSSEKFMLTVGTHFGGECTVVIANPEVSLRKMPWVSNAVFEPLPQMIEGFEVRSHATPESWNWGHYSGEHFSIWKDGKNVTAEMFVSLFAQNEWGEVLHWKHGEFSRMHVSFLERTTLDAFHSGAVFRSDSDGEDQVQAQVNALLKKREVVFFEKKKSDFGDGKKGGSR